MERSHQAQRDIVEMLLASMAEEFQYERVYSNLIINLANISYFIRNASVEGLTLNGKFEDIFADCASKIT